MCACCSAPSRSSRPDVPLEATTGEHDVAEIGAVDDAHWVEIQRAGFRPRGESAVVDLVAALHIRRLLSPPENELEAAALDELEGLLPALVSLAGVGRDDADAADAVTNVCDRIAFAFPFEEPESGEVRGITGAEMSRSDRDGGIPVGVLRSAAAHG